MTADVLRERAAAYRSRATVSPKRSPAAHMSAEADIAMAEALEGWADALDQLAAAQRASAEQQHVFETIFRVLADQPVSDFDESFAEVRVALNLKERLASAEQQLAAWQEPGELHDVAKCARGSLCPYCEAAVQAETAEIAEAKLAAAEQKIAALRVPHQCDLCRSDGVSNTVATICGWHYTQLAQRLTDTEAGAEKAEARLAAVQELQIYCERQSKRDANGAQGKEIFRELAEKLALCAGQEG